jgi:hypothetical protein
MTEFEAAEVPQTAAGLCAAAYFRAFNSDGDEMLSGFLQEYRSIDYLEQHPLEERLEHHIRLRGIFGTLTPVRVVESLEDQITLLVDPSKIGDILVMRFHLDEEHPPRLAYVTFTGIDHTDVPDDYVRYLATRAAPVAAEFGEDTVRSVARALADVYVYPELGRRMADTLLHRQARGAYSDLAKAGALADRLTEDAQTVSGDLHIWVEAQNPMAQRSTDPINRDVDQLRRDNFDFKEARVLPGNIGYIRFDMIHDEVAAQEAVAAGLADLADTRALIVDLRENMGGEWGTARLLLGYVLPGGTIVSRSYDREGALIDEQSVPQAIPGRPFEPDVPVYVLTSGRTGSAAEALAYTLKHMGRAKVVGEVTRGMAHPSEEIVVSDYFRVSVPFRRSEHVHTGTDWEGVGVIPDIEVSAPDALDAAVRDAAQRIREAP